MTEPIGSRATIVGTGAVGEAIASAFLERGWEVTSTFRRLDPGRADRLRAAGATIAVADLDRPETLVPALTGADVAVFTPILSLSVRALGVLADSKVARSLFFSSNNVATDPQAVTYQALAAAETRVQRALPASIILRPTLIYGDPDLLAVTRLCRLMRHTPVMPIAGSGMRQPIFHLDLAALAVGLLTTDGRPGIYAVGGREIMTNTDFYRAVSRAAGGARLLVQPPAWLIGAVGKIALALNLPFPLNTDQIARLNNDRRAHPQTPIPAELMPRTTLEAGLRALVTAMDRQGR